MPALNKSYVSAISLLDDRTINPALIDIHNQEGLTDLMSIMGRYEKTDMAEYHNFVNQAIRVQGDTTGATIVGSGSAATLTGVTLTAATSGFARLGDIAKLPNGQNAIVTVITTASSQDTLTLKSVNGANLTLVASNKIDFFSSAVGEASKAPTNRRTSMTKYSNLIQRFREVNEVTDVAKVSPIVVSFGGQNFYHVKEAAEKFIKFKDDVNGAMFGGTKSATKYEDASPVLVDPVGGGATQTTGGLDEYIVARGATNTVATPGTYALADMANMEDAFLAKKAPKDFIAVTSSKAKRAIDNCFKALGSASIQSARLEVAGKELDLQVDKISYGGFSFQYKVLPILDTLDMFSQTSIVKSIYYIPTGNVNTVKSGSQPRIKIRYQDHGITANNKGSEIWAEWHTGAAAPAGTGATGEDANWKIHYQTAQGLEVLGAEHFGKQIVL
jgi:hypothetical protein